MYTAGMPVRARSEAYQAMVRDISGHYRRPVQDTAGVLISEVAS